jgi:uncharacterized OB-fold protein
MVMRKQVLERGMPASRSDRIQFQLEGEPYTLAVAKVDRVPNVVGLMDLDEGDQVFISVDSWPQVRAMIDQYFKSMRK